jgi:hypothetical protein
LLAKSFIVFRLQLRFASWRIAAVYKQGAALDKATRFTFYETIGMLFPSVSRNAVAGYTFQVSGKTMLIVSLAT